MQEHLRICIRKCAPGWFGVRSAPLASGRAGHGPVCIPGFVIAFVAFAALRGPGARPLLLGLAGALLAAGSSLLLVLAV